MTTFFKASLAGAVVVLCAFAGVIIYTAKTLPEMMTGSKATIEQFFAASKAKQHQNAHETFSNVLSSQLSTPQLEKMWRDFEHNNGNIQRWAPADSNVKGGGRACLWPRYVDYLYRVYGTKGNRVFYARVVPEGSQWRIERLNVMQPAQNP